MILIREYLQGVGSLEYNALRGDQITELLLGTTLLHTPDGLR